MRVTRAIATAMKRAMATAARVMAMVTKRAKMARAIATATKRAMKAIRAMVTAMLTATRVLGEGRQQ